MHRQTHTINHIYQCEIESLLLPLFNLLCTNDIFGTQTLQDPQLYSLRQLNEISDFFLIFERNTVDN